MKNIHTKILFLLFAFFLLTPIAKAFTKLEASTQNPIVGDYVYIRVNLDYGSNLIKEMHFKVTYDPNHLEVAEQPMWTQGRSSNGEFYLEEGIIRVDKTDASDNWKTGAVVQIKFKVLKKDQTSLRVSREGDAYYSDGNIIPHENSSSITLYGKEPNSSTELRSLSIEGFQLNPVFSVYKRDYYLNVGADVDYVNIIIQRGNSTQIVEGDGIRELNYGLNKLDVVVKAQNGAIDTYHIKVTRSDNRTGDTSLKEISVSNSDLVLEEGKTKYETTVSRSVDNVLLSARASDPKATLVGTGRKQLEIGDNIFVLTVSSSNGLKTEYTINIIRSQEEFQQASTSSKLLNLRVDGIVFDLNNNKTNFLYSVYSDVDKLDINTITESKTAKVEIIGNESLKEGTNKIEIKVTEKDETESVYTIVVYKNPNAERVKDLKTADYYSNSIFETTSPSIISKTIFEKVLKHNTILYYNVENMYGGLLYQILFKTNLNTDINPSITRVEGNVLKYESNIPEGNEIVLYLDDVYKDGNVVKLTSYDETGSSKVITEGIKVDNGYVRFTSNGDKYYTFTASQGIVQKKGLLSYILEYKIVIVIVIIAIALLIILKSKKKKEPESKEPLY